jgi:hypothetical protein
MPVFTKARFRCLFIHIPKTGGTSLEAAMRRLGWGEQMSLREHVAQLHHLKVSPQHYHGALLDQILHWDAIDRSFTICRHPFQRFKSEYYWQHEMGIAPCADPLEWAAEVMDRCRTDPWAFDNHLRPQVDFLPPNQACEVFRLEDDGVRKALEYANALAPAGPLRKWWVASFPARPHRSTLAKPVEDAFAGLRGQIEDFYAADMRFFGY